MAGFFVLIVWAGIGLLLPACHPLSPGRPLAGFDRSPSAPRAGKTVSPIAPLIALGDSITAAGPWSEAFPGRSVLNAGISGNTTVDLLGRLDVLPGLGGATLPCEAARWGPRCLAPVQDLNRRLRGAVPSADFLDLTDLLADGAGLRRSMGLDGLHLGPQGYSLWFKRLEAML